VARGRSPVCIEDSEDCDRAATAPDCSGSKATPIETEKWTGDEAERARSREVEKPSRWEAEKGRSGDSVEK
jgi:hypothetical protein